MNPFHFSLHAQPSNSQPHATLAISFEEACERLATLPRLYCEPDGSFVWVSSDANQPWQIDGNLFDSAQGLSYVEFKGKCPEVNLNQLLGCFGWPETPIIFVLVREAITLNEPEFRRLFLTAN